MLTYNNLLENDRDSTRKLVIDEVTDFEGFLDSDEAMVG
jgi:hypothetical protein